ncbi:hypothetical protein FSP39_003692 [Pinctada imbricata]|uniref:Carboxylesterase type B domain-containing protein n=1 Tax=Pinctada imbricata TaxID=66713 RepID=A0AA88XNU7_PINIB|nr:hypothetical protein FSP39_003692 [Pinctada imbricata]
MLGRIEGVQQTVLNGSSTVYQFRKVPFAKKPERFSKPEPTDSWNGVLSATEFGPSCPQFVKAPFTSLLPNNNTNEDCLFLNIYVPSPMSSGNRRAVMVFIHGGRFVEGQGTRYDGSALAVKEDVIVVTINYRVGIFGFFTTGDSNAPGNLGLWDQQLGIKWVKDNIDSFGGNPSSITLFGQGAGAASVTAQSLYHRNSGNFQRIIVQSGSVLSPTYFTDKEYMVNISKIFADTSGCYNDNTPHDQIVQCLRVLSYESLLQFSFVFSHPRIMIDGEFLSEDPNVTLTNVTSQSYTHFRNLDVMFGTNDADGSVLLDDEVGSGVQAKYGFNIHIGIPTSVLNYLVSDITEKYYQNNSKINELIVSKYTTAAMNIAGQGQGILNFLSDFYFHFRSLKMLDFHYKNGNTAKTYEYLFRKRNPIMTSMTPVYPWIQGAPHGHELMYLFGMEDLMRKYDMQGVQEVEFSHKLMKLWANFAKTG